MPISSYTVRFAGCVPLAIAGLLLSSSAFPDQVYKTVDAQGHVTYSDRPTAAGAQKTDVVVQQANPKEAQRLAKERMLLQAEDDQRTRKAAANEQAAAKQDSAKKRLCDNARRHYNDMKDANRIYTTTADGNREYYTDAQADAMRTEAKRAMDAACGP